VIIVFAPIFKWTFLRAKAEIDRISEIPGKRKVIKPRLRLSLTPLSPCFRKKAG
jgi:hypothetical protein